MIYFLQVKNGGPIKIGFTGNDLEQRVQDIQVSCPYPLIVLGTCEGDLVKERALQRKFALYHSHGEWFHSHEHIKDYIRQNCFNTNPLIMPDFTIGFNLEEHLKNYECSVLNKALSMSKNIAETCKLLGISYRSLRHRLSKYKIKG